jgi:hypothetical protein
MTPSLAECSASAYLGSGQFYIHRGCSATTWATAAAYKYDVRAWLVRTGMMSLYRAQVFARTLNFEDAAPIEPSTILPVAIQPRAGQDHYAHRFR